MPTQPITIESIAKVLVVDALHRGLILTLGEHRLYPEKSFTPDLPGGIVDPGESEQQAVIREAKEECGIELSARDLRLVYAQTAYYEQANKSVTKQLYIAHVNEAPAITLSWEHSGYAWVSLQELEHVELSASYKQAIDYALMHDLV